MWTGSPALDIAPADKATLARLVRCGKTEQRIALRARIILGAAEGLGTSRPTIIAWRNRFAEAGVDALYQDRPRGRGFKPLPPTKETEVVEKNLTSARAYDALELPLDG